MSVLISQIEEDSQNLITLLQLMTFYSIKIEMTESITSTMSERSIAPSSSFISKIDPLSRQGSFQVNSAYLDCPR